MSKKYQKDFAEHTKKEKYDWNDKRVGGTIDDIGEATEPTLLKTIVGWLGEFFEMLDIFDRVNRN